MNKQSIVTFLCFLLIVLRSDAMVYDGATSSFVQQQDVVAILDGLNHGDFVKADYFFADVVNRTDVDHADVVIPQLQTLLNKYNIGQADRLVLIDVILEAMSHYMMVCRPLKKGFNTINRIFKDIPELWVRVVVGFPEIAMFDGCLEYHVFFLKLLKQAGCFDFAMVNFLAVPFVQGADFLKRLDAFIVYLVILRAKKKSNPYNSVINFLQNSDLLMYGACSDIAYFDKLAFFVNDDALCFSCMRGSDVCSINEKTGIAEMSFLSIAALMGCDRLFALFLTSESMLEVDDFTYALAGGNDNIIKKYRQTNKVCINDSHVVTALQWQRNALSYTLWQQIHPQEPFLSDAIKAISYNNIEWLMFIFLQKKIIEKQSQEKNIDLKKNPNFVRIARFCYNSGLTMLFMQDQIQEGYGVGDSSLASLCGYRYKDQKKLFLDKNQNSLLHNAILSENYAMVEYLIARKCDVNAQNSYGDTPLYLAVAKKNYAIIDLLLKNGAHQHIQNNEGLTPLHFASYLNDNKSILLLLKNAPYQSISAFSSLASSKLYYMEHDQPETFYQKLIYQENVEYYKEKQKKVGFLMSPIDDDIAYKNTHNILLYKKTPMGIAIYNNNIEGLKLMLAHGGKACDFDGHFPLITLAMHESLEDIVLYLLECDLSLIHIKNKTNNTLIHEAALCGMPRVIEFLYKNGLDCNVVNDEGETPIFRAFKCRDLENKLKVITTLVECGLDIALTNKAHNKPLYIVAKKLASKKAHHVHEHIVYKQIFSYLISVGADIEFLSLSLFNLITNAEIAQFFYEHGLRFDWYNALNEPIFHVVVADFYKIRKNFIAIVRYMLSSGLDINIRNQDGQTALHMLASFDGAEEAIKYFIKAGANIMAVDSDGKMPCCYACNQKNALILSGCLKDGDALPIL